MKIALVNNGSHIGISCIGKAYARAFELMGLDFSFLDFRSFPKFHNDQINVFLQGHLASCLYDVVIFIQPTYLYSNTWNMLRLNKRNSIYVTIQTEDPYSISAMLQMRPLFDICYTNEQAVANAFPDYFTYLPLAFDDHQLYQSNHNREYDFALQCSYYGSRIKYKDMLVGLPVRKHIGGNVSYVLSKGIPFDLTGWTVPIGLISRHKELEIYSGSKFVLNPHRPPEIVGKYDFMVPGMDCTALLNVKPISPNPRFWDAIGCGAIPLCDASRVECMTRIIDMLPHDVLRRMDMEHFVLPHWEEQDVFLKMVSEWEDLYQHAAYHMWAHVRNNETYWHRANKVLGDINALINTRRDNSA